MSKRFRIFTGVISLILMLLLLMVAVVSAVSGAAFTTYNPWVDGEFKDVCKNSQINCNIYGAKPDVWLNGGPAANGLGPDGEYFFAVLVPGGQPDPNDGGVKNLSDDFDAYTDRQFTVTNGEVSFYGGPHDQDSGDTLDSGRDFCSTPRGCDPDGNPPFIRLSPYADTTNPGGVYILAICSLQDGYPVEPRDCKYDAFKVKEGRIELDFMLSGMTFKDFGADGPGAGDVGRGFWDIHITGTGFSGESIDATVTGDTDGYWNFSQSYHLTGNESAQAAMLTVCAVENVDWYQTYPANDECYDLTIEPAIMAYTDGLDFGFWPTHIPPP